ncbi:MAG: ABC transporter substrate-binding protein [Terriglobia bacterium]|nr:MAG: ABC transporter substrate-binding protein [Terriglobia bacterium]
MKIRSIALTILGLGLFLANPVSAQTPIRVLVSNGVREVVQELRPQCERAIGHPLEIQLGSTTQIMEKVAAGEQFDVALLTTGAIDDLIKQGKVAANSRTDLARCGIGVGVRKGAPKPDIRTSEALKKALQDTKSISYAADGASRTYIEKMEERMGIAADAKPKTLLTQGSVAAGENVAAGKAAIVMTLISEILPMPGVELVGPFPAELQNYVNFAGGISTKAANADAGKALLQSLTGAKAAAVYKAKGMEPR